MANDTIVYYGLRYRPGTRSFDSLAARVHLDVMLTGQRHEVQSGLAEWSKSRDFYGPAKVIDWLVA